MSAERWDTAFRTLVPPALRRTALALFLLVLGSSAYFVQGTGENQNSRFDLVRAIAEQGTFAIDAYAGNTRDKAVYDDHFYSDKAPGLSFASVPVELAARALGSPRPERAALALDVVTVGVIGTTSALAAVALFLALCRMGVGRIASASSVAAWMLGTNAFGYLTLYYGHQLAGALLALAFAALCHAASEAPETALAPPVSRALVAFAGGAAAWAAITELPAAIAAAMLFAYGLSALGPRRMAPFALLAAVPLALWMTYNTACFGGPLRLGYGALANEFKETMGEGFLGPLRAPSFTVLSAIVFGAWRGLLPLSPFLILVIPGAVRLTRDPAWRREGWLAVAIVVYFLLFNASYAVWSGGASMGPRHVVPMLPFATILVAKALDDTRALQGASRTAARIACGGLLAASVATCTMAVAVMPEFLDQPTIRSPGPGIPPPDMTHPITAFVIPCFTRGYLSAKGTLPNGRMGIASTAPGHEWDAYNLGEAMGLRGLASLVPLLLMWGVLGWVVVAADERRAKRSSS